MGEYTITGEYKCYKQSSTPLVPKSIKEHFLPPYKELPIIINKTNTCGVDNWTINVCGEGSCCNPNGKCGTDAKHCISTSKEGKKEGILNGLFDNGGNFKIFPDESKPIVKNLSFNDTSNKCGRDSEGIIQLCKGGNYCQPDGSCTWKPITTNCGTDNQCYSDSSKMYNGSLLGRFSTGGHWPGQ